MAEIQLTKEEWAIVQERQAENQILLGIVLDGKPEDNPWGESTWRGVAPGLFAGDGEKHMPGGRYIKPSGEGSDL